MREAAIHTLPSKRPPKAHTNTLPHWWTPQLSALSSEANRIQNTVKRLRRRLPDNHRTVTRTTARLVTLRRALRVSAAKTKKHHSAAYYSTIARTIHKSILRPLQSNKAAWNSVQRRRRTNSHKPHIPTNMRGADASHAQDPLTSAMNWHTAWASVYRYDAADPSFNAAETQKDLSHFKSWVDHIQQDKDHKSTRLDRAFRLHEIRHAMTGLKNFKRHGSDRLPPDLLRHGGRWMAEALRQLTP